MAANWLTGCCRIVGGAHVSVAGALATGLHVPANTARYNRPNCAAATALNFNVACPPGCRSVIGWYVTPPSLLSSQYQSTSPPVAVADNVSSVPASRLALTGSVVTLGGEVMTSAAPDEVTVRSRPVTTTSYVAAADT